MATYFWNATQNATWETGADWTNQSDLSTGNVPGTEDVADVAGGSGSGAGPFAPVVTVDGEVGGSFTPLATLDLAADATATATLNIDGGDFNVNTILDAASLTLGGPSVSVDGRGTIDLGNGGTLSVINKIGTTFNTDIDFEDGSADLLNLDFVPTASSTAAFTVNGFNNASENVVDLPDVFFGDGVTAFSYVGSDLKFTAAGVAYEFSHFNATALTEANIQSDGEGGTMIACFAAGTRILTAHGEVAVEALKIGDAVVTLRGGRFASVTWLGHRTIDCSRHPDPSAVWPIRVQAGAFGPAMPHADLVLSPDHSVLVDGSLIPIRHLVNGGSIAREPRPEVTYWHLELERHDVVLAAGLPAESYLDTGNRDTFGETAGVTRLHADFAGRRREAEACAPPLVSGPELRAARCRLVDRARLLGTATPLAQVRLTRIS